MALPDPSGPPPGKHSKLRLRTDVDALNQPPPPEPPAAEPAAEEPVGAELPAAEPPRPADAPPYRLWSWKDAERLPLPAEQRAMTLGVLITVLALGLVLSWQTAVAGSIIALAVTATFGRLAGVLTGLQVPRRHAIWAALGTGWVGLGLLLLVWAPLWQHQAAQYAARLGDLAANADQRWGAQIGHWPVAVANAIQPALQETARAIAGRRVALLCQLILLIGGLTTLGAFRPEPDEPGKPANVWRITGHLLIKLFSRIGFTVSSRLGKALALGLLAGIGLQLGGVAAGWFVAGNTLLVALLVRSAPVLTVLCAAPMIPGDAGWMRAAGFVVATGIGLFVAEKKLHWHLYLGPALATRQLVPEVYGEEAGGGGQAFLGGLGQVVRLAVALAVLGLIAGLLWVFVPAYQQREARLQAVEAAETPAALLAVAERYPDDAEVLLKLTKAFALSGDVSNAMQYAELYANWHPKPVATASTREKLYQQALDLFAAERVPFNRAAAHEFILAQQPQEESPVDARRDFALKVLTLNPDSLPALSALATECLLRSDADQAIEHAQRGAKLNPHSPGWHALLADAYLIKKDWARVIAECDAELELRPDDDQIHGMRAVAVLAQEKDLH